jgi:hypothetical protein
MMLPRSFRIFLRLGVLAILAFVSLQPSHAANGGIPERLLGPPPGNGPAVVRASFHLNDINDIDDEEETFEFTGTLVLNWKDPRQAFDPAAAGVSEKVYQGNYQFDEISPAWYPQIALLNQSGMFETTAVTLRVRPDGGSTLVSTINAVAEADFSMRRYPFDRHRLEAVLGLPGFHQGEVRFEMEPATADTSAQISQWTLNGITTSVRTAKSPIAGLGEGASEFVVSLDVARESMFTLRLVVLPLAIIVMLSWSVFWMERSSLGDRISVSFVGILTAVAYQIVVGDLLPHVSYVTLMHGFLNLSLFMMSATVVINLYVGACDQSGKSQLGDMIDHRCRWIFPLSYVALILALGAAAWIFF